MKIINIANFIDTDQYKFVTDLNDYNEYKKKNVKTGTGVDLKNFIKSLKYCQLFKISKFNKEENTFGKFELYYCRKDGYIVKGSNKCNSVDWCVNRYFEVKWLEENNINNWLLESIHGHGLFLEACIEESKNKNSKFGENGCYSLNELVNNYFNTVTKICILSTETDVDEDIDYCKQLLKEEVFSDENRKAFDNFIKRSKRIEITELFRKTLY